MELLGAQVGIVEHARVVHVKVFPALDAQPALLEGTPTPGTSLGSGEQERPELIHVEADGLDRVPVEPTQRAQAPVAVDEHEPVGDLLVGNALKVGQPEDLRFQFAQAPAGQVEAGRLAVAGRGPDHGDVRGPAAGVRLQLGAREQAAQLGEEAMETIVYETGERLISTLRKSDTVARTLVDRFDAFRAPLRKVLGEEGFAAKSSDAEEVYEYGTAVVIQPIKNYVPIGALGNIRGTSIIPYGTTAILSVCRATEKRVVKDGEIRIRPMLDVTLSFDHRVIDGAQGVRFTSYLAGLLDDIRTLLL